ncbi:MAG TPA: branched-chain amino acid ABC transporter permease [Acetobacteraceae bacterium]|nr:branched-chain amino acid ABC transporter permease [Acetobacteraceae bacterium]
MKRAAATALALAAVAAFAVAPFLLGEYRTTLLLPVFGYGVALLGFNLLFGYGGLLSFGHALFVAIGAYAAAVTTGVWRIESFEVALLAATGAGLAVALPVGALCARYTRIFFGMLTLAFGMLFHSFLFKFYDLTGGDQGMRVRRPTLLGLEFEALDKTGFLIGPFYWYCLALAALLALLMWRVVRSPFGLALRAQRDNPRKAEYLGVEVHRTRFLAFLVAAVFGAIGGAMLAVPVGLADPELAFWTHSGTLVFMTVLGGFAHFTGPLVGALVYVLLQDSLVAMTPYWRFLLGAVLALIVLACPQGLMGLPALIRAHIVTARRGQVAPRPAPAE